MLGRVSGQEDVHLSPQLQGRRSPGSEEQVARARAVPSEHFSFVVHAKYLEILCSKVMLKFLKLAHFLWVLTLALDDTTLNFKEN